MTSLSRLARLPPEFLTGLESDGYRAAPPAKRPEYTIWLWSFVGTFCGLSILQTVFGYSQYFVERNVPSIIASYGASAVLCFGVIEAPLVQPRALMGGHFISALTGVLSPSSSAFSPRRPASMSSVGWPVHHRHYLFS
ncbi:hypothetical protein C8R44DRAFT_724638 [Mycena epipterygia]|nr:hypothetical protein C8R44DRAFT_724638 [Mycena epipterygia]